jgi:DNA repair protein RecO (recombination protein O)
MHHKTQAIILNTAKYSDRYAITHVFTRDFGRVAYLLPRSQSKRQKIKTSLFFPLSVLNLETEHLPLRDIQRLKEAERAFPLYDVCVNMTKVSLSFFLSEFLSLVLRENERNTILFDFLRNSIEALEATEKGLGNFHLTFMIGLTRFLGIYPNMDSYVNGSYFDLLNGEFVSQTPLHTHFLSKEQSRYLHHFQRINYGNMHLFRLSHSDRNAVIDVLLTYYRLHVWDFPPLKSLEVLREMVR